MYSRQSHLHVNIFSSLLHCFLLFTNSTDKKSFTSNRVYLASLRVPDTIYKTYWLLCGGSHWFCYPNRATYTAVTVLPVQWEFIRKLHKDDIFLLRSLGKLSHNSTGMFRPLKYMASVLVRKAGIVVFNMQSLEFLLFFLLIFQSNFISTSQVFLQGSAFENARVKIAAILYWPQCVQNRVCSVSSAYSLHIYTSYQATSGGMSHVTFVSKFEVLANSLNL